MEIIILVDILRRANINVVLASVEKSPNIVGSQRIKIVADKNITSASDSKYDLIILPVSFLPVLFFYLDGHKWQHTFQQDICLLPLSSRMWDKLSPSSHLIR